MEYEQLELPFQYDGDDYEHAQSVFLDEPAYDWRERAEAAEAERDELREALTNAVALLEIVIPFYPVDSRDELAAIKKTLDR